MHKTSPTQVHNLAKYPITIHKIAKDFQNFAKVAKFHKIWSLYGQVLGHHYFFPSCYEKDFLELAILGFFLLFSVIIIKNITNITSHKCEKCPSSICYWDPNPQPIEHESLPITTRTGLPPYGKDFCSLNMFCYVLGWSVIL